MDTLWYYAIAFLIIWIVAIVFRDKLKIEIKGPLLMRKTKRMRSFIDSIAQRSPRFWRITMNIGIPVAFVFMGLIFYLLVNSLQTVMQTPTVSIVIPGVETGSTIYVPLVYGIIGIATVVIVHEFGHGILARVEGVKIKSIGLLLLAILPGAFVEPDEEGIEKSGRMSKLRIYAAGSISNLGLAGIALLIYYLLSTFFIVPAFHAQGLEIVTVVASSPADGILKEGMILQKINGQNIKNRTSFTQVLDKIKPGDKLTIQTNDGSFVIKTAANPNNKTLPYIGIRSQEHLVVNQSVSKIFGNELPWSLFYFASLLFWIFFLNFGIGTFNLLPLKPLDGGLMFEEVLNYVTSENKAQIITYIISVLSFVLVAINIGYGFFKSLF